MSSSRFSTTFPASANSLLLLSLSKDDHNSGEQSSEPLRPAPGGTGTSGHSSICALRAGAPELRPEVGEVEPHPANLRRELSARRTTGAHIPPPARRGRRRAVEGGKALKGLWSLGLYNA